MGYEKVKAYLFYFMTIISDFEIYKTDKCKNKRESCVRKQIFLPVAPFFHFHTFDLVKKKTK